MYPCNLSLLQVLSDYKSEELDLTNEAVFRDLKKPSELVSDSGSAAPPPAQHHVTNTA